MERLPKNKAQLKWYCPGCRVFPQYQVRQNRGVKHWAATIATHTVFLKLNNVCVESVNYYFFILAIMLYSLIVVYNLLQENKCMHVITWLIKWNDRITNIVESTPNDLLMGYLWFTIPFHYVMNWQCALGIFDKQSH